METLTQKNGENKQFTVILYKLTLIFESENNIISIKLNQSNNCCLYCLKSKDLNQLKSL